MQKQLETHLKAKFPEIERIFARTGTAEIAADPMPPNISDGYIMLKPMDKWPEPRKTRDELLAAVRDEAAKLPGNNYEFSQPIQLRFNELISGVRSDVAVKVFGDDEAVLNDTANRVAGTLQKVSGATEVKAEQTTGLPMLNHHHVALHHLARSVGCEQFFRLIASSRFAVASSGPREPPADRPSFRRG